MFFFYVFFYTYDVCIKCIYTVSSTPSPSSSSFSDKEHLRKISKSVPSFLENEVQYDYMECLVNVIFLLLDN